MGAWSKEPESLLPTAEPTREDVVFFAGFYEGEGSACGHKTGGCIVQVPQKDPEVLYRARSLWGGTIRPNSRGISVWVMSGDRARKFLIDIYPLLSTRRKAQIEKAGGLKLTGKKTLDVSGMSPERLAKRAAMNETQRHSDSCSLWYQRNREKAKATSLKWQAANRELINQRQRDRRKRLKAEREGNFGNSTPNLSERSQLVN